MIAIGKTREIRVCHGHRQTREVKIPHPQTISRGSLLAHDEKLVEWEWSEWGIPVPSSLMRIQSRWAEKLFREASRRFRRIIYFDLLVVSTSWYVARVVHLVLSSLAAVCKTTCQDFRWRWRPISLTNILCNEVDFSNIGGRIKFGCASVQGGKDVENNFFLKLMWTNSNIETSLFLFRQREGNPDSRPTK